jgi:hypothetical protein
VECLVRYHQFTKPEAASHRITYGRDRQYQNEDDGCRDGRSLLHVQGICTVAAAEFEADVFAIENIVVGITISFATAKRCNRIIPDAPWPCPLLTTIVSFPASPLIVVPASIPSP